MSYFGYRRYGYFGAFIFPLVFLAPSIVAILLLSWASLTYGGLSFVQPLFVGLGALVVALLLSATLSLGRAVFTGGRQRSLLGLVITAGTFVGSLARINLIWLVLASGLLGIALFRRVNQHRALALGGRAVEQRAPAGLETPLTVGPPGRNGCSCRSDAHQRGYADPGFSRSSRWACWPSEVGSPRWLCSSMWWSTRCNGSPSPGFIGLVAAVTIPFGIGSLISWQTWLIFVAGFTLVWWFKRSAAWAILGTVVFALVFITV